MAEKSYLVKLSANTQPYIQAFKSAETATDQFSQKSKRSIEDVGRNMQDVGGKMTAGVTLPLVGVAGAAVKMSNDFDGSMSKIVGLVGIASGEVDDMKASVLDLAGETAVAPQELADALFVVTSAGLRGKDAMDALELAAKGSAAGLGETQDIARAVAGAMNAYGTDVLDAAEATDILTATARAGNFETSQLAGSLGRVLPFAKAAGASFEEVGGAIALLTRVNGDAGQSVTQVAALMKGFVTPTAEATKILGELGMTSGELRKQMGEEGLVATLRTLDEGLDGNQEKYSLLLGGAEAAGAALQILDADAETLASTFGVTAEAAGMTQEAFDAFSSTEGAKMKQALVDIQIALIEVGSVIGPIVADIAGGLASVASAFADLDPTLQKVVIGIAGVAAAAGPLLVVTGSLIRSYATLKTTMVASDGAMTGTGTAFRRLAVVAGIAAAAYGSFKAISAGVRQETEWLHDDVSALEKPFQMAGRLGYFIGGGYDTAKHALSEYEREAADSYATMTDGIFTMDQLKSRLDESTLSTHARNLITIEFRDSLDKQAESEKNLAEATAETESATRGGAEAAELARLESLGLSEAVDDTAESLEEEAEKAEAAAEAQAILEAQTEQNARAMEEWQGFVDKVIESHERLVSEVLNDLTSMFDYEQAVLGMDNAYAAYEQAIQDTTDTLNDSEATDRQKATALRNLRDRELDVAEQAYETAAAYAEEQGALEGSSEWASIMASKLEEQAGKYPHLREEIDQLISKLGQIPSNVDSSINITTYYRTVGSQSTPYQPGGPRDFTPTQPKRSSTPSITISDGNIGSVTKRARGGPVHAGRMYEVDEHGASEMFRTGGRSYLMPGTDGYVTPLSGNLTSTTAGPGGGDTNINVTVNGKLLYSQAQLGQEIKGALRQAGVKL